MHDVGQYRSGIRILCEDKAGPQTVSSKRHNNTSRVCTIFARSCRLLPPNSEVGTGPMEHVVGMSIGPNEGHARRPLELDERDGRFRTCCGVKGSANHCSRLVNTESCKPHHAVRSRCFAFVRVNSEECGWTISLALSTTTV
jgi:hypothetical protein